MAGASDGGIAVSTTMKFMADNEDDSTVSACLGYLTLGARQLSSSIDTNTNEYYWPSTTGVEFTVLTMDCV